MVSKKGKGSKSSGKDSLLGEAIKDLELQIHSLGKEKSELKSQLAKASSSIDADRDMEKKLQERIAALIEKEARLNEKKKKIQTDIDSVSDKLGKITKIKSEMSDI